LYGGMVGGFAVMSDVYKTKVYELAHCIIEKGGRCLTPRPPFRILSYRLLRFFILFDLIRFRRVFLAGRILEITNGFSHAVADLGQFACAEYNKNDYQDNAQFPWSQTT
jgi:hypothetical protein